MTTEQDQPTEAQRLLNKLIEQYHIPMMAIARDLGKDPAQIARARQGVGKLEKELPLLREMLEKVQSTQRDLVVSGHEHQQTQQTEERRLIAQLKRAKVSREDIAQAVARTSDEIAQAARGELLLPTELPALRNLLQAHKPETPVQETEAQHLIETLMMRKDLTLQALARVLGLEQKNLVQAKAGSNPLTETLPELRKLVETSKDVPSGMRRCSNCLRVKPLNTQHFAQGSHYRKGFKTQCRQCDTEQTARWQKEHPDQFRANYTRSNERQRRERALWMQMLITPNEQEAQRILEQLRHGREEKEEGGSNDNPISW